MSHFLKYPTNTSKEARIMAEANVGNPRHSHVAGTYGILSTVQPKS